VATTEPYIIRGGAAGRERLRVLSRIMQPSSSALLKRLGAGSGMACLDVGCGGGDIAFELARMVGPAGRVVGWDIDETILELARSEAQSQNLSSIEFKLADITCNQPEQEFDLVHARFVLTHLVRPEEALKRMYGSIRPGGVVILEDIDLRGYFCYPDHQVFRRYVDLHTRTMERRGCHPHIGPQLPALLIGAGFRDVGVSVVQPAGMKGDVKLISPITMENIADAIESEGLADRIEIDQIIEKLYEFAEAADTVAGLPRIVEAWGYRVS
jgi:SAM-dependent methyltransferase